MTCLDSGIERLDQAFRQSYYHTQQPNGQPFGACVGAALDGKMRAITLDFKESHHERTLPYKRTDPRVFHGTFSGGTVSGNDGEISAECTSVLAIFGRSARYEGYRYGLEKAPSERRKIFSVYRQRIAGGPELSVQFSQLVGLPYTLFEDPAPPVPGDRAGAGSSRL